MPTQERPDVTCSALVVMIAVAVTGATGSMAAEEEKLASALLEEFQPVRSLDALPTVIQRDLGNRIPDRLAGPGEPFRATDVIIDDRPSRRLVLVARASGDVDLWVVCYEHGGRGHHYHIVVMTLTNGQSVVLKAGQWSPDHMEKGNEVTLGRVLTVLRNDNVKHDNHW